jgi:hypothetical protein
MKLNLSKINWKGAFIVFAVLIISLPFFSFAGHNKKIYVDSNAGSEQDGSSAHPYKTIGKALDKAKSNTEIHISNGTYKENLEIPSGVDMYGQNSDKTIIKARNGGKAVISLKGSAKLVGLTIRDGKNGIKITNTGRVKIFSCNIEKNGDDGILIYSGSSKRSIEDSNQVMLSQVNINHNGKAGLYSEKRNLIIYKSDISDNKSDGVSLASGVKAWIGSSTFVSNSGSGMATVLDGTQIYTKNNVYSNNKREGIEVSAYGASGRIDINKSKIRNNGNYGIARVNKKVLNQGVWGGLTVENTTYLYVNKGQISPVFRVY